MSEREIDYWIHEHLFGAKWMTAPQITRRVLLLPHDVEIMARVHNYVPADGTEEIERCSLFPIPAYSADIDAAFKIVDAMKEKGFLFAADNRHPEGHWAEFATEDYERGGQATGDTFAEAIARAAKAALEGEK